MQAAVSPTPPAGEGATFIRSPAGYARQVRPSVRLGINKVLEYRARMSKYINFFIFEVICVLSYSDRAFRSLSTAGAELSSLIFVSFMGSPLVLEYFESNYAERAYRLLQVRSRQQFCLRLRAVGRIVWISSLPIVAVTELFPHWFSKILSFCGIALLVVGSFWMWIFPDSPQTGPT